MQFTFGYYKYIMDIMNIFIVKSIDYYSPLGDYFNQMSSVLLLKLRTEENLNLLFSVCALQCYFEGTATNNHCVILSQ